MSQINGGGGSTDPLILVATTSTAGQIQQPAGTRLLHTYGTNNTFYGSLAGNFTLTSTQGVGIGTNALLGITSGNDNTAVGYDAGYGVSSGAENTYLGSQAGYRSPVSGSILKNTGIGFKALFGSSAASATAVGDLAGNGLVGTGSVAIGASALSSTAVGAAFNVAVGFESSKVLTTGSGNATLGYQSGVAITQGGSNVCIGYIAGQFINTGNNNTCIGMEAGSVISSGSSNVFVGTDSGYAAAGAALSFNTAVGAESAFQTAAGVTQFVCVGYQAGRALFGSGAVAIGYQAMKATANGAINNTAVGYQAAVALSTGTNCTFLGYSAGLTASSGISSTMLGAYAGWGENTGDQNTYVGHLAGASDNGTSSGGQSNNTHVGWRAGCKTGAANTSAGNTSLGRQACSNSTSCTFAVCVGYDAGLGFRGTGCVAIGTSALKTTAAGFGTTVAIGYLAGTLVTTGIDNVLIGDRVAQKLTTGSQNVILGHLAGNGHTTGVQNVLIGDTAGSSFDNTASAAISDNIAIGFHSGNYKATGAVAGTQIVAIGTESGTLSGATGYVSIGYQAGTALVGDKSVAIGWQALHATTAGAARNVVVGNAAGTAVTSGTDNTLIGDLAGNTITTGVKNTFVGSNAQGSAVARTGATAIGYGASAGADYVAVIGANGGAGNAAGELNGVGVGTTTPTAYFSSYEKIAFSKEGALLVKLTNKTGGNSTLGAVVSLATGTDNAFILTPVDDITPVGIVYQAGVADGAACWIAVSGRAQVNCGNAATRGAGILRASATGDVGGGAGIVIADTVPITTAHHDAEIGHPMVTTGGAGLVWAILHFR